MPPSFLTTAVFAAEATDGANATGSLSINDLNEHSFDWVAWAIILTVCAIAAICLAHLLTARRRTVRSTRPPHDPGT